MNSALRISSSTRSGLVGPLRASLMFIFLLLGSVVAQAQTTNWTGNTNRDWSTAGNWSAGIPTAGSDVVIPSAPANQPVLSTTATAKSVEVQAGASLSISNSGSLTLNGSKPIPNDVLNFTCTFLNDGSVNNSGQVVIGSSATASVGQLGIRNNGTFANNTGGSIAIDRTTSTGLFNVNGSFSNSATITIGAVASVGEQGILNQATFANNTGGSITIDQISLTGLVNNRSFTNSAQITIRAGRTGISNGATNSTFQNTGCAALINIVADAYILNIGTFSNGGTIIENATGNSRISSNAGLVQNLNGGTFTITGTNTGLVTTIPGSLPVITATPSLTITQGQSATLTASGAQTYSWSSGQSTSAISVSVAGPYSVTGTTGGCSATATVTVSVTAVTNPCGLIVYVTQSGAGSQNGSSWDNAFAGTALQTAINTAAGCSAQVWVATGTYKPTTTTDRTINFSMKNGVTIYGGFPNAGNPAFADRNVGSFVTILSGDIDNDNTLTGNSYHVISNPRGLTPSAVLDGVVITGGNANSSFPNNSGGGVYDYGQGGGQFGTGQVCSPTFRNCSFQSNSAAFGGAIYNNALDNGTSSPVLINCAFQSNAASSGGAVFNDGFNGGTSSPVLTNCAFQGNTATNNGGAIVNNGANSSPVLTNCVVFGNGGSNTFYNNANASLTATYSLFDGSVTGYGGSNNLTTTVTPFASTTGTALSPCSPAINAGNNAAYTNIANAPSSDLAGNPRIFPANGTIDMGAYEYQTAPFSVSIAANPSLTITQGQSTTLTASGASSYSWSSGASTAAISVSVAGPYSVTGIIGSCSSVASVTLTVNVPTCGAGLSGPTWTGCVSTDWNTAGNWASGAVPTATDDVVIPSAPANQPVLSTTATAKSVEVQMGASLSISSAGRLTINSFATLGGFPGAFYNQGTVNNNGTLMLGNTAPVGLIGLHNIGTFTNTGTLQVDRATNQGINNRDRATFTNTGSITIGASVPMGTQGIWNQATFTHTGGTITIDRITGDGLLNSGNFVNSATITIGASASVTGNGIQVTGGSFQNNTGSSIQIDRTGSTAIVSSGTFTNAATISIGASASLGGQGISNSSSFTNSSSGTISINRTRTGVGGDGVYNLGTFANAGRLIIGDIAFVAQDDIYNQGTFTNTTTGEINADRAAGFGNGIWNNGGAFQNSGRVVLGANATTGSSGILNTAIFTNNTGGDITIDRPTGNALNNANGNALFTNAGRIRIGQSFAIGNLGLSNSASAIFRNNAGGSITIDRTNNDGLTNITSATFVNSSIITVGTSATIAGDGIENSATFSNSACATLTVFDNINNSGDFTNAGLFTVNTAQAHTNTGTLTNNGVIEYPQGNPIPNVTNNDVIAAPISSGGNTFSPALQLGGNSNQFTVGTTWYANPGLTTSAGTYNQGTNTLTAMNLAPGSSTTLYFAVTDNASGCTRTLSIVVTVQIRLTVLHRDVDNYADNNAVQPLLQLVNQGDITLPLSAITLRYYLTVEGAAALSNLAVFDAQVGTNNVRLRYVPLSPTQQGATGYVEVSFTEGAGNLIPGANSGSIKAYFAKSDYSSLNEADDYSYAAVRDQLVATLRITAYYNGTLVAGIEPGATTQIRALRALTESKNGASSTQISTYLEVRNEGNVPINYSELKARYYFTSDGTEPLQVEVDEGMVQTQLVALSPAVNGANYYLELRFTQGGQLAPGASTGTIRYRIAKPQGGRFDQSNDYSYQEQPADRSQNSHVTVYVGTERVWGTPPAGAGGRIAANSEPAGELSVRVLGNPVTGTEVIAEVSGAEGQPLRLQLVDLQGRLLSERLVDRAASVEQQRLAVSQQATGLLLLQVSTPNQRQTVKVLLAR